MTDPTLRHALEELQQSLDGAKAPDDETVALLRETVDDIRGFLERSRATPDASGDGESSFGSRLEESLTEFEASHPQIAGLIQRLMDALAQAGI